MTWSTTRAGVTRPASTQHEQSGQRLRTSARNRRHRVVWYRSSVAWGDRDWLLVGLADGVIQGRLGDFQLIVGTPQMSAID